VAVAYMVINTGRLRRLQLFPVRPGGLVLIMVLSPLAGLLTLRKKTACLSVWPMRAKRAGVGKVTKDLPCVSLLLLE